MQPNNFVSDLFYFPSVYWYAMAIRQKEVNLPHANYDKSYHLNKTNLFSANGKTSLSIPLLGGREQRLADTEIKISYAEPWQQVHLKSIKSMYGRAPFFENVIPYLENFYARKIDTLFECNMESVLIINKLLRLELEMKPTNLMPVYKKKNSTIISYNQVFAAKHGFIENLSILDLLMNEGRNAIPILNKMNAVIF